MRNKKALIKTMKKMVPAVLIAMLSTGLGLLSLYRSKVPMINDFGTMLTIGIVVAFIIGVFIFIPFLYIKDKHFPKGESQKKLKEKKQNHFITRLVGGILKIKYVVLFLSILLAILGLIVDQDAEAETNIENFMPQDSEALSDIRTLRDTLGSTEQIAIILEDQSVLSQSNFEILNSIDTLLLTSYKENIIETSSILNLFKMMGINTIAEMNETTLNMIPLDQRKLFVNESLTKTVINVSIVEMSDQQFIEFLDSLETNLQLLETESKVTITGQSVIDSEMMTALTSGRYEITLIGILLIFLILFIIYKSFYRAILPLIPILMIVGWSGGIMALFGISYTPLTATLGALIMGIGTEFTIIISERFEEEKLKTESREEAIKNTLSKMANPILVSAITTMGGFSALIFSDFIILSNFGIMTLVNLSLALLSTIVVLPAILALSIKKDKELTLVQEQ